MREFTKSLTSFSWALSLFGLKQMSNLFVPAQRGQNHPATDAFTDMARCAEDQLGQTLRAAFQAGDRLQRGMVDVMFSVFLWPFDPRMTNLRGDAGGQPRSGSAGGAAMGSGFGASGAAA